MKQERIFLRDNAVRSCSVLVLLDGAIIRNLGKHKARAIVEEYNELPESTKAVWRSARPAYIIHVTLKGKFTPW